jgi:hypothetical protein
LQRFEFQSGFFGGGVLQGLEVSADADAVEVAIDAEREHAIPVPEPADGELIFVVHA